MIARALPKTSHETPVGRFAPAQPAVASASSAYLQARQHGARDPAVKGYVAAVAPDLLSVLEEAGSRTALEPGRVRGAVETLLAQRPGTAPRLNEQLVADLVRIAPEGASYLAEIHIGMNRTFYGFLDAEQQPVGKLVSEVGGATTEVKKGWPKAFDRAKDRASTVQVP